MRSTSLSLTVMRANNFVFGWANACERYACGESTEAIISTPTKDSAAITQTSAFAVTAGVHAALGAIAGNVEQARETASEFRVKQQVVDSLVSLALDA